MTRPIKNVLITGAYGGLGQALAKTYLLAGYNVALLGRDWEKLTKLTSSLSAINKPNCTIEGYFCDLNDVASIMSTVQDIKEDFKKIDILINCAGIFPIKAIKDMTIEEYNRCMQVNVAAPFLLIKELSKEMVKNKWGRIINIASSSAYGGSPNTSIYCASKHALLGLSRSLYKELKPYGVRVFCVSPGSIQTEMGKEVEKLGQVYNTFMTPEEVADYILLATSYDGKMISEEIRLNRVFVQ